MTLEPFVQKDELLIVPSWMENDQRLAVGFTTRLNGVSSRHYDSLNVGLHVGDHADDVIRNRQKVADKISFGLENWVIGEQIHGSSIQKVEGQDKGSGVLALDNAIIGVDGLYTVEKGVLLASLYADCVPLYFYSKEDEIIGLAHAGWRGTVEEIGPKMINTWVKEGIPIQNIRVLIGPSIGKAEYKVDQKVIDQVNQVLGSKADTPYEEVEQGQYLLDLKQVNLLSLRKSGLEEHQITVSEYCTATRTDLFFSHRKENGQTGRMMSYIGYTSN